MKQIHRLVVTLLAVVVVGSPEGVRANDETVDYVRDVKPILKERCYACHGALKQEAGLRLDTAAALLRGGDSGPAAVAGKPETSLLMAKITAEVGERMPPEGAPLADVQVARLKKWIEGGAVHPANETPEADPRDHWAFRTPVRPALPTVANAKWHANPVDRLVAAEYAKHGLQPVGQASRSTWLRRVYLDLTGLPPTPSDLEAFLADDAPDSAERVIDRLLASPAHAEHWARHWMDVWRYADWYGRRHVPDWWNSAPQIWRWRDWIVKSLSQDKGYDRMIQEMLAADEIAPTDDDAAVATGYLVRNWYALNQNHWMREVVEHTGKAFLGLTFNCAHCHDHKYDPIEQRDYFRLRAFFEPLHLRQSRERGEPDPGPFQEYDYGKLRKVVNVGSIRIFDKFPEKPTHLYMMGDERSRFPGEPTVTPGTPAFLSGIAVNIEPVELPLEAFYPNLRPFAREALLAEADAAVAKARGEWEKLPPAPEMLARVQSAPVPSTTVASVDVPVAGGAGSAEPAASNAAASNAVANGTLESKLLGRWRFSGATDETFLADDAQVKHRLERVAGSDPPATSVSWEPGGWGESFWRLPWATRSDPSRRAAFFQQDQSFAYLATAPAADLHANQWSMEMLVRPTVSAANFNRTLAELEGSWTWLHRGLDAARSELRLIYWNEAGQRRDVATGGGDRPLFLTTDHDYYVAVSLDATEVKFFACDLTDGSAVQTWSAPRGVDGQDFSTLRNKPPARCKIGNSDGTGRHCGLIDEVSYWGAPLTDADVAARVALAPPIELPVLQAAVSHELARTTLATAEAARDSLAARIEAELAKYARPPAADVAERTQRAADADRRWRIAVAEESVARACQERIAARAAHKPGDAALDKKLTDALAKVDAAYVERARTLGASSPGAAEYRPVGEILPNSSTGRRAALARWMTDRTHPLTARVAVNHVWKWHFGRPLVDSVFDLGRNGKSPSHPELLDWLAVELMDQEWSFKRLHRTILSSELYRRSSQSTAPADNGQVVGSANAAVDPDNRYLWRFPVRRLESESIRDSVLMVAGELDRAIGGTPVDSSDEMASRRRSLYHSVYPEDGGQMKFAKFFDAPDPSECYRRTESVIPQQALVMTNGRLFVRASRDLAERLARELASASARAPFENEAFVRAAYRAVVSRDPSPAEVALCVEFLSEQQTLYAMPGNAAPAPADKSLPPPSADPAQRARESLVRSLFNHHDFLTIR